MLCLQQDLDQGLPSTNNRISKINGKWVTLFKDCHYIAEYEAKYRSLSNKLLVHKWCCANEIATCWQNHLKVRHFLMEGLLRRVLWLNLALRKKWDKWECSISLTNCNNAGGGNYWKAEASAEEPLIIFFGFWLRQSLQLSKSNMEKC